MISRRDGEGSSDRRDLVFPFVIEGIVVEGDRRGRELGYPTANVLIPRALGAPEGVFAGTVRRSDGSFYQSAISIGRRETFYGEDAPSLVEAFLLDFVGDLYGELLTVEVALQLREQRRFSSVEELIAEIARDVNAVRRTITVPPQSLVEPVLPVEVSLRSDTGRR
jgi:riboflavin kinase/FMN adenylyltransferase